METYEHIKTFLKQIWDALWDQLSKLFPEAEEEEKPEPAKRPADVTFIITERPDRIVSDVLVRLERRDGSGYAGSCTTGANGSCVIRGLPQTKSFNCFLTKEGYVPNQYLFTTGSRSCPSLPCPVHKQTARYIIIRKQPS